MNTIGRPYNDSDLRCLDMRDILIVCSSLVSTTDEFFDLRNGHSFNADVYVRLAHSSVKESLMSSSIRSNPCAKFAVAVDCAYAYLARANMAYLMHFDTPPRAGNVSRFPFVD